ncbi:MAG: hypothetical protein RML33_05235 [Acidobacteriota bacterium]|nr:hypothetical protein [Pyrinomonadaceae bacterium]MDW8304216.1 hypothetical protein [Acidobacteriota bacterium]
MKTKIILLAMFLYSCFTYDPSKEKVTLGNSEKDLSPSKQELVGLWHEFPMLGSGWGNVFRFWSDGSFRFHASQMKCLNRELGYAGTWKVETNKLILLVKERNLIMGGKIQKSKMPGICPREIVGGKEITKRLKETEVLEFHITEIRIDNLSEDLKRPVISIGKKRYWQFSSDPEEYP